MEALSVLLFTFFSQLRFSITRGEATGDDKQSSSRSSSHHRGAKDQLSWITLDVDYQSIRDYFPAEFLKGVNPSAEHLIPLRLSVLLDAFQQLFQRYRKLLRDNESMQTRLKCLPELVQQKTVLEAKLREREGVVQPYSPSSKGAESQHDVGCKLQRLQSLERAYVNAEERCKQLVEVTQQWSAECADKDKLIAVQATQIEQLTGELDKTQKRLNKYNKHWIATKDAPPPQRVPDAQFEELRLELACRRELHDQVGCQTKYYYSNWVYYECYTLHRISLPLLLFMVVLVVVKQEQSLIYLCVVARILQLMAKQHQELSQIPSLSVSVTRQLEWALNDTVRGTSVM